MSNKIAPLTLALITSTFFAFSALCAETEEVLIDAVIASVDGKPITLQDVEKKLSNKRSLKLADMMRDEDAKLALETLIAEKVILQEAENRRVGVTNSEIEEYITEVAKRNNLSREAFEAALISENKNIEDYKRSLKVDILKSKLSSSYVRGSVSVSEDEIDQYIEANPELSKSGAKVKLSQILVSTTNKTEEEALAKISQAQEQLKGGENFSAVAKQFSEGGEAKEGGSLGIIAEEDLSREIFDAIFTLKNGDVSGVTRTGAGYHLFKLDDRLVADSSDDEDEDEKGKNSAVRAEVKKILMSQKMQEKMAGFFTDDIYKTHTIDRKI